MAYSSKSFVRAYNRYSILDTIRTHEKISRIDISKVTGLSPAAITGITSELVKEGLIIEKEAGEYAGGRRPVLLAINPEGTYVMGVNIKRTEIYVVIINSKAEMKASYMMPIEEDYLSPEQLVGKIARGVLTCLWESNFSKDKIAGIGLSISASVDSASGIIRSMPNYSWANVDIRAPLQERINHKVYIDNNTNNLALFEQWFGEGKGLNNFIVVSIENVVGAGCVVNGQLMHGHSGMAGGFGNMSIDPKGPSCMSQNNGFINSYASTEAILNKVKDMPNFETLKIGKKGRILFEDLLEEIDKGNAELMEILASAGKALGLGLSNLIQLFNPEKIIFAGSGVKAGDALFEPMYECISQKMEKFGGIMPNIVVNPWVKEGWAIGAGTLVLQEIYKSPSKH